MNGIPFDTLKFALRLKAAGFTEAQAEVITEMQKEVVDNTLEQARHDFHLDDVSTKRDLKDLEVVLRTEIKALESELSHKIELLRADAGRDQAETKADLTRWIIAAGFLQTTVIVAVLLKIAHLI
ncbi:DUF1640 domain-containing protein [Methylomonas koyamae]|uniref:DUF1640 domain-containing protein n=1 Tax=Methylomonas koyamae TaxID=702114 RepID=UPI002873C19E|nr:DUF1640 domain-containing protein [Methylomonas koyamae]WNB76556.1 DUF1640 domain-containing protein [Methylomonas koyamae]